MENRVESLVEYYAPLEVGTTEGYTSFNHLMFDGSLARWPYNSELIHLFQRNFSKPSIFDFR